MGETELAELAKHVRRYAHWALFLLAASLLITAIDLQLKRSLGRQAVEVSRLCSNVVVAYGREQREQRVEAPDGDGDLGVRGAGDHLGGTAAGPAANGDPDPEGESAPVAAPRRQVRRAGGDGQ